MSALTTLNVCASVSPTVLSTCFGHFLNRKARRQKPTKDLRYELGLRIVRSFIENSGKHPVEAIQAFTTAYIPVAPWVRVDQVTVPTDFSHSAAEHLCNHLGPKGVEEVGGSKWWQWRKDDQDLKADWIEMQTDYNARGSDKGNRILLYLHGGAYYFGSADEHRYQIQRHARKLKARAFAPRYRLAPQFPFPSGLHDCLAAYLYLLSEYDSKCILISGDSAGGGMTAALLVVLRDQGIPLPAGAMLLSPWVDLTHSFPSILGDGDLDYIPIHGFVHRPSVSWPPPPIESEPVSNSDSQKSDHSRKPIKPDWIPPHIMDHHVMPCVELNGQKIHIKEQIQLYAPNFQLVNPLVSPILNPSLGGLPPLLIQVGGGELIGDEQVYFAHKAANPTAFPPSDEILDRWDPDRTILNKYPPTYVQLQVWNDVCHVPHTLAWTKPAKYMYRSVAQFGAWALARAQHIAIDIDDEEDISGSDNESTHSKNSPAEENKIEEKMLSNDRIEPVERVVKRTRTNNSTRPKLQHQTSNPILFSCNQVDSVGKAGDPLPPFVDNMIRQRIDRHGIVYPLGPASLFFSLQLQPHEIGVIKEAPVHRWRERQEKWVKMFSHLQADMHAKRAKLEEQGLPDGMDGERPPPTALIRRWKGEQLMRKKTGKKEPERQEIAGLKWWSGWGSKQDAEAIKHHAPPGVVEPEVSKEAAPNMLHIPVASPRASMSASIHTHRRRKSAQVVDEGQADAQAISSHPSSSGLVPQSTSAIKSDTLSDASHHLQVPQIDDSGRNITSSTVSIKSGTVGEGVVSVAPEISTTTEPVQGLPMVKDSNNEVSSASKGKNKMDSEEPVTDMTQNSRPMSERFYSANEAITR